MANEQRIIQVLSNLTYQDLPTYVKKGLETEFQTVFEEHPDARAFMQGITISVVSAEGFRGRSHRAEYYKDRNHIDFFLPYLKYTSIENISDEELKRAVVLSYFGNDIIEELVHSLQNYFSQQGAPHPKVAPYPDEDNPEYSNFGQAYWNDPGEMQAHELKKKIKRPYHYRDEDYFKDASLKLSGLPNGEQYESYKNTLDLNFPSEFINVVDQEHNNMSKGKEIDSESLKFDKKTPELIFEKGLHTQDQTNNNSERRLTPYGGLSLDWATDFIGNRDELDHSYLGKTIIYCSRVRNSDLWNVSVSKVYENSNGFLDHRPKKYYRRVGDYTAAEQLIKELLIENEGSIRYYTYDERRYTSSKKYKKSLNLDWQVALENVPLDDFIANLTPGQLWKINNTSPYAYRYVFIEKAPQIIDREASVYLSNCGFFLMHADDLNHVRNSRGEKPFQDIIFEKNAEETFTLINEITTAAKKDEPSEAQKDAGNYKKDHVKKDGLDITIENKKGSTRSGTDSTGEEWSIKMKNDYGYIKGTVGFDKDHVDVFLSNDYKEDSPVFIVNQLNDKGKFDEHKCMLGFENVKDAEKAYTDNYEDGWDSYDDIVEMPMEEFKEWVYDKKETKKPAEELKLDWAVPQVEQDLERARSAEIENMCHYMTDDEGFVWNDAIEVDKLYKIWPEVFHNYNLFQHRARVGDNFITYNALLDALVVEKHYGISSSLILTADPLTYTDKSDMDMSKSEFDGRANFFHQDIKGEEHLWAEPDYKNITDFQNDNNIMHFDEPNKRPNLLGSLQLFAGAEDRLLFLKNKFPTFTPEQIQNVANADPTPNKQYVFWIAKQLTNASVRLPEDAPRVLKALQEFTQLKTKPDFTAQKDINQYGLFNDLEDVVDTFSGAIQSKREKVKEVKQEGVTVIAQDDPWKVIEILTPEAMCQYAENTKWCVSDFSTAIDYLQQGPLYLVLKNNIKFGLLHITGSEDPDFMDVRDRNISLYNLDAKLKRIFVQLGRRRFVDFDKKFKIYDIPGSVFERKLKSLPDTLPIVMKGNKATVSESFIQRIDDVLGEYTEESSKRYPWISEVLDKKMISYAIQAQKSGVLNSDAMNFIQNYWFDGGRSSIFWPEMVAVINDPQYIINNQMKERGQWVFPPEKVNSAIDQKMPDFLPKKISQPVSNRAVREYLSENIDYNFFEQSEAFERKYLNYLTQLKKHPENYSPSVRNYIYREFINYINDGKKSYWKEAIDLLPQHYWQYLEKPKYYKAPRVSSLKFAEDLSFNKYDKTRGQQGVNYEIDSGAVSPLDMGQSYNTDYFLPDLQHDEKERGAMDWTGRENLQLGFGSLKFDWNNIPDPASQYSPLEIKKGDLVLYVDTDTDMIRDFVREIWTNGEDPGENPEVDAKVEEYVKIVMHKTGRVETKDINEEGWLEVVYKVPIELYRSNPAVYDRTFMLYAQAHDFKKILTASLKLDWGIIHTAEELNSIFNKYSSNHYSGTYAAEYDIKLRNINIPNVVREAYDENALNDKFMFYQEHTLGMFIEGLLIEENEWINDVFTEGRSGGWLVVVPEDEDSIRNFLTDYQNNNTADYNLYELSIIAQEIINLDEVVKNAVANFERSISTVEYWEFPEEFGQDDNTTASQKFNWSPVSRYVWLTMWAIPTTPQKKVNPTEKQQNWTVVTYAEDYDEARAEAKKAVTDHMLDLMEVDKTEKQSYYFLPSAYLWHVKSEKLEFLTKYFTGPEIEELRTKGYMIVDKKEFDIKINNPLDSL